ncbi:hypothetical protein [Streptomyces sp. NPDC051776]
MAALSSTCAVGPYIYQARDGEASRRSGDHPSLTRAPHPYARSMPLRITA